MKIPILLWSWNLWCLNLIVRSYFDIGVCSLQQAPRYGYGTMHLGDRLVNDIASTEPTQLPYRPLTNGFFVLQKFFRHLPASSLLRGCAYLGNDLSSREETCFAKEWLFGRRTIMTYGYFAYWTQQGFLTVAVWIQKDTETLWSRKNDRSITTTSLLVMHLINTGLGAEDWPKAVRVKDALLGHPPLALAALSISNVALVGLRSYRTLSALLYRGVR